MYVGIFACIVCLHHTHTVPAGSKRGCLLDTMETNLQMFVSCHGSLSPAPDSTGLKEFAWPGVIQLIILAPGKQRLAWFTQ